MDNQEMEAFVVNSVKIKLIKKLDSLLEKEGRVNARELFLVPIFTIKDMAQRVETFAPEMKTLFFKELMETVSSSQAI